MKKIILFILSLFFFLFIFNYVYSQELDFSISEDKGTKTTNKREIIIQKEKPELNISPEK